MKIHSDGRNLVSSWWVVAVAARRSTKDARRADEHPVRRKILRTIKERLGINEVDIQRAVGAGRSTVRHHLNALMDAGLLERYPVGRENHYFPAGTDADDARRLAMATHGRAKRVLREVFLHPGWSQTQLADRVGMTRKTLRGYLDFLIEQGLLEERRGAQRNQYWPGSSVDASVYNRVFRNPHAHVRLPDPGAKGRPPRPDDEDCPDGLR